MVTRVSPNCTKIDAKRNNSSIDNPQEIVFAKAVIDVVNSHSFKIPPHNSIFLI